MRHEIGEGFFDDMIADTKKKITEHIKKNAAAHHKHIKTHMKATAVRLAGAKDKKAELQKIKKEMKEKGLAKVAELHEKVKTAGAKHLEALMVLKARGAGAAMVYVVQRSDAARFAPAGDIDPAYARLLVQALQQGVEVWVVQARVGPGGARQAASHAMTKGTEAVKAHVAAAPEKLRQHLAENKDKYIALAKNAAVDVAQNGREGLHRQLAAARKGMVAKARSVAGCEGKKKKGSGFRSALRDLKRTTTKGRSQKSASEGMGLRARGLRARGLKARGVKARGGSVRII